MRSNEREDAEEKRRDYPVLTCAQLVVALVVLHREKHLLPLPAPLSPVDPFPRLGSRSSDDSRRTVPSKGFVRVRRMAVVERGEKGKEWSRARITCAMQKSVEKWKKATLAAASPSSSRCLIQINTRICMCVCGPEKG